MNLSIRVSGVENLNTTTLAVLEYLKYRPVVQPLDSFAAVIHPEIGVNLTAWEDATHTLLVFHRPPVLKFKTDPFPRYLCNNPDMAGILSQGENYVMDIQVLETFDTECEINNGYLNIRNAGATVTDTILRYDSEVGFRYQFTAGNPNLVSPYQHICYIAFYSNSGELLAEKSLTILVEGSSQLPGSDIILDITGEGEDNTVPIPVYVLRDPPGDGSTSKIEKGSTVSKKISLERETGGGIGIYSEGELSFAVGGLFWEVSAIAGGTKGESISYEVKTTTKEDISTDGGPIYVGVNGDVIVGMGMAFQYGLTKQIFVDENNCSILDKTEFGIAPNGIKTQWMYTVKHIKALIYEYEQRRDRGDRIQQGGQLWSYEDSRAFFQTKVDNWNSIMEYHQKETLPHYNLCAKSFDNIANYSTQSAAQIQERQVTFNEWQTGFCNEIGKYENGTFILDEEITWNQALIDKYNVAETVLRNIADIDYNPQGYDWQFSEANLANTQKYLDAQFDALHGIAAENLTFSAGLAYNKSIESARASSHTLKGTTFLNFEGKLGFHAGAESYLSFDPVTNVIQVKTTDVDFKVGAQAKFDVNVSEDYEKAVEEVNAISYELTDDDETDQFSVTVIQGIEPNQTPYFSLLGGRSTCPDEEGTIFSDDPRINILKDGGATKYDLIENVDPDGTAKILIQISSLNPFHSTRDITLTNILSSNPGGASIKLGGNALTNYTFFNVSPDEPIVMELTVSRGPSEYEYDNMKIAVIPTCYSDPEITYTATNGDTITFSVHFSNPCSDIVLASPEDNWVIQRRNLSSTNNQEALPVKVAGFDVNNPEFRSIRFEYRRTGVNNEWIPIAGSVISRDSLEVYQSLNVFPGEVPYYWFIWDITDDFDRYPNGNYEVRAVAECMIDGKLVFSYTSPSSGTIDRNMQLLGLPEPSDQIWTYGDEIAIRFMSDIQCNKIDSANFILKNKNELVGGNYTLIPGKIYCQDNRLRFIPDALMKSFDGDTLEFTVSGVYSVTGEIMNDQIWSFAVSARDLYMDKTKFDVQVYQGESITVYSNFYNKKPAGTLTYSILGLTPSGTNDGTYANWLTARNSQNITLAAGGNQTVYFDLSAANLEPGYYQVSLDVQDSISRVYTDALTFEMKVLPKASGWSVNPALYENSMTVMANYRFTNPLILNTDTTDLISVWIGNEIRGVGKIEKVGANVLAAVNVYGNAAENGKPLMFRIWDTETGNEYDASPPSPGTYQSDGSIGMITNPLLLNVNQVEDKARYIALAQGWNLFSLNTSKANDSLNKVLMGLRHPNNGDVIKTASKSATYSTASNSWITANGLYTMNIYNGYQMYLSQADTLRITGTISGTLSRDSLFNGWNLIGVPLAAPGSIHTVLASSKFPVTAQPDSMQLKTTALPGYDYLNMTAYYKPSQNPDWLFTVSSGMDEIRPTFGYRIKVNKNTSLCMSTTACSGTTLLRTGANSLPVFDRFDTETWVVNPSAYEFNMLITGYVEIDDDLIAQAGTKVAAYIGNECRGVGELVYVPELKRYMISMFVYANEAGESMSFRIYEPQNGRYYEHFESLDFESDKLTGTLEQPYRLSNFAPDNAFSIAVYPNPFQSFIVLNITSDLVQDYQIQLTDLMGRVIESYTVQGESTAQSFEIRTTHLELTEGVYLLHIKGSLGEQKAVKVIYNP